ncbi:MAG: hypothetical protein M9914_08710 [Trueperaceae bacterium]|nr:hypothetical protein [Trueperaceae bacterium]
MKPRPAPAQQHASRPVAARRRGARSMLARLAVALLLLGVAGVASAQCSRGPRTASITLPGFLAVYYQQFSSNAAADTAEFYGGVCVTAVGGEWTVLADRVHVGKLSTDIFIQAAQPTLYMEGWRMSGEDLVANVEHLTLTGARFTGPDVGGSAGQLDIELATGAFTLADLVFTGSSFAVTGQLATLQGAVLQVEGAGVTTCIGPEPPPFAVESRVATIDLDGRAVHLKEGLLRVGNLRIPLRDEVDVNDRTFADFEFPVKVANVEASSTSPAQRGEGLSVRVVGIPLADGVTLELGATGVNRPGQTAPVALLRAAADGGRVRGTVGLEAGAPYLDVGVSTPLEPWLTLAVSARSGAAPARRARHEGRVGLEASLPVPALNGAVAAEAFAAITALTEHAGASQPEVAGARLGVSTTLTAGTGPVRAGGVPLGTFGVEARAQVTRYPYVWGESVTVGSATQWGLRVAPTWRLSTGPVTASLGYDARFTNAASPFGTAVDGLTALQRATGSLAVQGGIAGPLSGRLAFSVTYDAFATPSLPVGFKRLRGTGSLSLAAEPWTVGLAATVETAGLVNALTDVPAFVEVDLSAMRHGWPVLAAGAPYGSLELGLNAQYGLLAASSGLERLELRAGVPLAFESVELRPFVAVDLVGLLGGGSPKLSGYGLDATFITCCGSFTLGALNTRGAWGASIAVDLERRPGGAGGTATPTQPAPVEDGEGNDASTGIDPLDPGDDAGTDPGIMPGTP